MAHSSGHHTADHTTTPHHNYTPGLDPAILDHSDHDIESQQPIPEQEQQHEQAEGGCCSQCCCTFWTVFGIVFAAIIVVMSLLFLVGYYDHKTRVFKGRLEVFYFPNILGKIVIIWDYLRKKLTCVIGV